MANKRIKDLTTTATEADLVSGNYFALDGSAGTKKFQGNLIAKASDLSAEVARVDDISASIAPEYDSTTGAIAGNLYMHEGTLYLCNEDVSGAWDASKFTKISASVIFQRVNNGFLYKFTNFNLIDIDDADVALGKSLNNGGSLMTNPSYNTTGFVKTEGSLKYVSNKNIRFLASYDESKVFIRLDQNIAAGTSIPLPINCKYVRVSFSTSYWNGAMLSAEGCLPSSFLEYGLVNLKDSVLYSNTSFGDICGSLSAFQSSFFEYNLINLSDADIALGKYINISNGSLSSSASYNTTGWIACYQNSTYVCSYGARYVGFYDKDKNYIGYAENVAANGDINAPKSCKFIRITFILANWNASPMLAMKGSLYATYLPYGVLKLKDSIAVENNINGISGIIPAQKCKFFAYNLINLDDTDVALGKYVNNATGALSTNAGYNTTGYMEVSADIGYTSNKYINFYACYNKFKGFISGGTNVVALSELTLPSGTAYIRVSYSTTRWSGAMFSPYGGLPSGFLAYGSAKLIKSYTDFGTTYIPPILGRYVAQNSSLSPNTSLTTTGPENVSKNIMLTARVKGSLQKFAIGVAYTGFYGCWAEITPTEISIKRGINSTNVETLTHSLTLDDNLLVTLWNKLNDDGTETAKIRLSTQKGGLYEHTISLGHPQGTPFVRNMNTSGNLDVEFTFMPRDADKPIWIFGDSYLSYNDNARWLYYPIHLGFNNFLLAAKGGESSSSALSDFNALIANHAKLPSFAVWCMGMNGGDDAAGAPNANWLTHTQEFIATCKDKGIVPILMTIPSVPNHVHEEMNSWIRASGERYIDADNAVEEIGTYTWKYYGETEAYLSSDLVHPTTYGAKAIANQVLIDFPEISIM